MWRIVLVLCFPVTICRNIGERWLHQPDGHIKKLFGNHLHMDYEYAKPPGTPTVGKLYFAHHMPEEQHENILIEAKLNPNNGTVTIVYEMFPGKVSVTSQGRRIMIRMDNLTLADRGRYLTDVNFDTDAALHDVVVLSVFEQPSLARFHPEVIIQSEGNFSTLIWNFNTASSNHLPRVSSVTISHRNASGHWTEFINHQKNTDTDQWLLTYPDDSGHFKYRISYAPGPKSERVQMTLWEISPDDKGGYKLEVHFEDDVFVWEDYTTLHVTPGHNWKCVPKSPQLIAQSSNVMLTFTPEVANFSAGSKTYKLEKRLNEFQEKTDSLCTWLEIDQKGMALSSSKGSCVGRWQWVYNETSKSVSLSISDAHIDDDGSYTMTLMDSGNIVRQHEFDIIVVQENDLEPDIDISNTTGAFQIEIKMKRSDMKANISIFHNKINTESNELLYQARDTYFLHSKLPMIDATFEKVFVQVDYIDMLKSVKKPLDIPIKDLRQDLDSTNENQSIRKQEETIQLSCLILVVILFMINVGAIMRYEIRARHRVMNDQKGASQVHETSLLEKTHLISSNGTIHQSSAIICDEKKK